MIRFSKLLASLLVLGSLGAAVAAPAEAAPKWDLYVRWAPTNLAPGQVGQLTLRPSNLGTTESSSAYSFSVTLPPGVKRVAPSFFDLQNNPAIEGDGWSCTGTTTVTCTSSEVVHALDQSVFEGGTNQSADGNGEPIYIRLAVAADAPEATYDQEFEIAGGGAPQPTTIVKRLTVSATPTGFGVERGSFQLDAFGAEEPSPVLERQANGHPFELRVSFDLTLLAKEAPPRQAGLSSRLYTVPAEEPRTLRSTLPRGLIGNPEAVPKCTIEEFMTTVPGATIAGAGCPEDTQVGFLTLDAGPGDPDNYGYGFPADGPNGFTRVPLYNLEPKDGVPADFAFNAGDFRGHIYPNLDPANNYAIMAVSPYITSFLKARRAAVTIWGVPGDPRHDHLRFDRENPLGFNAPFNAPIRPLLTLSPECGTPYSGLISLESWQNQGTFTPTVSADQKLVSTGCDDPRIRFNPRVSLKPTSTAASGPTGLAVNLLNPQREDLVEKAEQLYPQSGDIRAIATPPIKKAVVTLPEGMTVSPSAAQGLGSCTSEQIGIGTDRPVRCPENSQYGTLTVTTPILAEPVRGRLYIAKEFDNPFNDFLAIYLVVEDPKTGILLKIPAKVELDQRSGRIQTSFDDLPPFPVSSMVLSFKGGSRAALVNPATCGRKTIRAELYSWSNPNHPVVVDNFFDVARKDDGSPCVNGLGERPFRPQLDAGTVNPSAAAFSPFSLRLTRSDDDQEFSQLAATLPPGLTAKLAGIARCSEEGIARAEGRVGPGDGSLEKRDPSCPDSSYIGTTDVGTGVGVPLTYIRGRVYLAGPYKGAPLSMVVITPATVGPFDLGVIAVRSSLDVDPNNAQASALTDPFPQIFQGIPVRIRDIRLNLDRPEFVLNPTDCSEMQIRVRMTGTGGDTQSTADDTAAFIENRFQAANCSSLPFKPKISFELKGGTKRGQFPAMIARLKARPGDANIRSAKVTLPRTAFLEQAHIRTICTRVQFAAKACPPASVIGHVKARTPLLDEVLSGQVVMRSSNNKLPDMVATLNGIIEVSVASRIDSFKRRVRATFDFLPDVPVSNFELRMQGGKRGLIVNSADLCRVTARADVRLGGHNRARHNFKPKVKAAKCKGKHRKKSSKGKKSRKSRQKAKR